MNNIPRQIYIENLELAVQEYREILEGLFGPCDTRFIFGTIRQSKDDIPCIFFRSKYDTDGGFIVDIHISDFPWDHCSPDQGRWQVAHECVHLLDPGIAGTANFLEEGLATWFQNEPRFHNDAVKQYINQSTITAPYDVARDLVLLCMPQLITAVKEIRESGTTIREISTDMLTARLSHVDREIVKDLCAIFPNCPR